MARNFTGYTCSTADSLLLNAGAFFKNFDILEDTYETAMQSGKCLGATQGGGSFVATPEVRQMDIDGADSITVYDTWEVKITSNLIEIKPDTLKLALGSGVIAEHNERYFSIKAKRMLDNNDFLDNITWIGSLSGSNEPVIIQIFNAINTSGLTITVAPKAQSVLAVEFTAKSDTCKNPEDIDFAPFVIYYPRAVPKIEFNPITTADISITGNGVTGATVTVYGENIPTNTTALILNGKFSIDIPKQALGSEITGFQEIGGRRSLETKIYVEEEQEMALEELEVENFNDTTNTKSNKTQK